MFRKIHSNRDPGATVYSETRKEFGVYFQKAGHGSKLMVRHYPKQVFSAMLALMLVSLVLSFTAFRHSQPKPAPGIKMTGAAPVRYSADDGFSRILATGAALRQVLHLRNEVETLVSKKTLSRQDSLALEKALDSLQLIHHQIN